MRQRLTKSKEVLAWLGSLIAMFAACSVAIVTAGGVHLLNPAILLIPALAAAYRFKLIGGTLGGLLAGLIAGPWMPAANATSQLVSDWLPRLITYSLVGTTAGGLSGKGARNLETLRNHLNELKVFESIDRSVLDASDRKTLGDSLARSLETLPEVSGVLLHERRKNTMEPLYEDATVSAQLDTATLQALSGDGIPADTIIPRSNLILRSISNDHVVLGALVLHATPPTALSERFLQGLQNQLAIALITWQRQEQIKETRHQALLQMGALAEARHGVDKHHVSRVRQITTALSIEIGCPEQVTEEGGLAALVHDIGKLKISEAILKKPDTLTQEEFQTVKEHTVFGKEILQQIGLETAASVAYCHHEKWDGTGYPEGIAGEDIPLTARVVAIADVFDALVSSRPYKPAWPLQEAKQEIVREAGYHFDPKVVQVFERVWERGQLTDLYSERPGIT